MIAFHCVVTFPAIGPEESDFEDIHLFFSRGMKRPGTRAKRHRAERSITNGPIQTGVCAAGNAVDA
jgi:hypothetical protein